MACERGEHKSARHIRGRRADVRRGIDMADVSAITHNARLEPFYDRLVADGERPRVALTAVMLKLVVIANMLLTENRHWQPHDPKTA